MIDSRTSGENRCVTAARPLSPGSRVLALSLSRPQHGMNGYDVDRDLLIYYSYTYGLVFLLLLPVCIALFPI